jgi:hypothetical protein
MLNEYVARERVADWLRAGAENQRLVKHRPEKQKQRARHRGHRHRLWNRVLERPPVQA